MIIHSDSTSAIVGLVTLDRVQVRGRPEIFKGASRPSRESHVPLRLFGLKVILGIWKREGRYIGRSGGRESRIQPDGIQISKKCSDAKEKWNGNPALHGKDSVTPPPPKKSCLGGAKNGLARAVAQIRSGHWRSAVYLKRIRKRETDQCWFCFKNGQKTTRSHVLLHCTNGRLVAARQAWGGVHPGGVRMLLASPRWERRLLHFLELSGVGRVMENGEDEEENRIARMNR
jgi:hypothetical protein